MSWRRNRRGSGLLTLISIVFALLFFSIAALEAGALFWDYLQLRTIAQLAARAAAAEVDLNRKELSGVLDIKDKEARRVAQELVMANLDGRDYRILKIDFPKLPTREQCQHRMMRDIECRVLDQYPIEDLTIRIERQVIVTLELTHHWEMWPLSPIKFQISASAVPQVAH